MLTTTLSSLNFVGSAIDASVNGGNVTVTISAIAAAASGNGFVDVFTGNGSRTNFGLSSNVSSVTGLIVFVDGIYQIPGVNFTANGNVIVFSSAPETGSEISVQSPAVSSSSSEQPSSISTISSLSVTAIDLTSKIYVLNWQDGTGYYTLANGSEGQIMYLVPGTGNNIMNANIRVGNVRVGISANGAVTVKNNANYLPFFVFEHDFPTLVTGVFVNGAWSFDSGLVE